MTFDEMPETLVNAAIATEALRRLNYPADELFLDIYKDMVQVRVQIPSGKAFTVDCGPLHNCDKFAEEWQAYVKSLNENDAFATEMGRRFCLRIIDAGRNMLGPLYAKGVYPPALRTKIN